MGTLGVRIQTRRFRMPTFRIELSAMSAVEAPFVLFFAVVAALDG